MKRYRVPLSTVVAGICLSWTMMTQIWANDNPLPYPPLPEAISSFGATVSGNDLSVFSGHIGQIPGNSIEGLSPHFARLNWTNPASHHAELAMHVPSQSSGLVAWQGLIYRVGGLSFKNHTGEETVFNSLDIFAQYDPKTNTWKELAPLPSPWSSLVAAVVGDHPFVVGGWNLQAGTAQGAPWHEEALMFELTPSAGHWKTIAKPPFVTRALAAAAHHDKLYVLGGMHRSNSISKEVHNYDPATDQ